MSMRVIVHHMHGVCQALFGHDMHFYFWPTGKLWFMLVSRGSAEASLVPQKLKQSLLLVAADPIIV